MNKKSFMHDLISWHAFWLGKWIFDQENYANELTVINLLQICLTCTQLINKNKINFTLGSQNEHFLKVALEV